MNFEKDTKEKVKRIYEGMIYHMRDLADFMGKHLTDPYFQTEEGMKLSNISVKLMSAHVEALSIFMFGELGQKKKEDTPFDRLEELLRSSIEENEGS